MSHKQSLIEEFNKKIIRCDKCGLRKTCIQPIPGEGNINCSIMFLGEGPGETEDQENRVFCGKSGRLLNAWIIKELNLERKDVFITNIVKCRPPNNRDPLPEEVEKCRYFLDQQIEIIQPKIIITLGRIAATYLLQDVSFRITRDHGHWRQYKNIDIMPIYHPAFLLRQMSEKNKNDVKEDFKLVLKKMIEK